MAKIKIVLRVDPDEIKKIIAIAKKPHREVSFLDATIYDKRLHVLGIQAYVAAEQQMKKEGQ